MPGEEEREEWEKKGKGKEAAQDKKKQMAEKRIYNKRKTKYDRTETKPSRYNKTISTTDETTVRSVLYQNHESSLD